MATEGTPNSQTAADADAAAPPQPPSASPMPGTLALLAASAVGSLLGSRIGAKSLAVAVGATALAWLNRRPTSVKGPVAPQREDTAPVQPPPPIWTPAPATQTQPPSAALAPPAWPSPLVPGPQSPAFEPLSAAPAPASPPPYSLLPTPPDPAADPRIQAWLARQMDREERADAQESVVLSPSVPSSSAPPGFPPVGELPFDAAEDVDLEHAPAEPTLARFPESPEPAFRLPEEEDDYRPEPLVADSLPDASPWLPDAFAALTEPRPQPAHAPTGTFLSEEMASNAEPPSVMMVVGNAETEEEPPAAPQPLSLPPVVIEDTPPRPVFSSSFKPQSLPASRPSTAPLAAPFLSASAIPGIEPLPSWTEISERPPTTALPSFPSAAPSIPPADLSAPPTTVGVDLESLFDTPVFDDSSLPADGAVAESGQIEEAFAERPSGAAIPEPVPSPTSSPWQAAANTPIFPDAPPVLAPPPSWAPASATSPLNAPPKDRIEEFFSSLKSAPAPPPEKNEPATEVPMAAATPVPEIAVHVAAAGEAWFDSPLAAAGVSNPWLPPKGDVAGSDVPLTSSFTPLSHSSPSVTPVVDAEVVLRPRAPTQASVVAKNAPAKPAVVDPAEADPMAEDPSAPNSQGQSPREQRARAAWRSWWKGD